MFIYNFGMFNMLTIPSNAGWILKYATSLHDITALWAAHFNRHFIANIITSMYQCSV